MPHLIVQHSANVENSLNIADLCTNLHSVLRSTGVFPLAGIRVRAFRAEAAEIADQLPENGFIDMVLRIGEGRSAEVKQQLGEEISKSAEEFCASLLATPYFCLSLEIVEINKALSWKTNTIHSRLGANN